MIHQISKSSSTTDPVAPAQPTPGMIEVAPNRWVQMDLNFTPPEIVLCDVVPLDAPKGAYKLVPRTWERMVRLDEELTQKLGFAGDTKPLRRLIKAGFVDGVRVGPRIYLINLVSYDNHLKRCAEDPYFWENPKVLKEYKTAFTG